MRRSIDDHPFEEADLPEGASQINNADGHFLGPMLPRQALVRLDQRIAAGQRHDAHHARVKGNYSGFFAYLDGRFGTFAKGYTRENGLR